MSKQKYYAVVNRGEGFGHGTRIKITENKHPKLNEYVQSNKEELEKIHAETDEVEPLKFVEKELWDEFEKELKTKFEVRTMQILTFGSKVLTLIAPEDMYLEIKGIRETSHKAREWRQGEAKALKLDEVFPTKICNMIRIALKEHHKFSKKKQDKATLEDLLLISPNELKGIRGFGEKAMNLVVETLRKKELIP